MQRQGFIDVWYDRDINAGAEWEREIDKQLKTAQIVLLLISPDFMDSDYCYSIEMKEALERHKRGEANVIPVILRQTYWQEEPIQRLQALPVDARPVKSWPDIDEAFFNVAEGIRKVVKDQFIRWSSSYYEAKNYEESLAAMQQVIRLDPRNAQQHKNIGDVLSKLGRNEGAVIAFDQAITLNPKYAAAYNNKAWALNELQRYEEALKACESTIELDPNYGPAYRNKSRALYELKSYKEALETLDVAILLDPNNSEIYESKGRILYLLDRLNEALVAYEQAIKLNGNNPEYHKTKGMLLYQLNRNKEALDAFEQAIQLDPNLIEAHEKKAAILQDLNRIEESHKEVETAQQIRDKIFLVEMKIESVRIKLETGERILILQELEQKDHFLMIPIANAEAYAIAVKLQGTVTPRPLSHDLFKNILEGLGAIITMVVITDLIDDIFVARIRIKIASKEMEFDSRPSDAVALALHVKAPIFVERHLLDKVGIEVSEEERKG